MQAAPVSIKFSPCCRPCVALYRITSRSNTC